MTIKPDELAIPIIDLEPFRSGTSEQALNTGKEVYEAFRNVGFAYIKNHGLPQELLDQAFEWVSSQLPSRLNHAMITHSSLIELQVLCTLSVRQGQGAPSSIWLVAPRILRGGARKGRPNGL
jgi:hypothetical protein